MKNSRSSGIFDSDETIKSLNDASLAFSRYVGKRLSAIGMRSSYRQVIDPLMQRDGMTQLELVKITRLKAPTISITLRNMERDGIVRREKNDSDRRETHVYITAKGREMHKKAFEVYREATDTMLSGISEKELKAVRVIINRMADNLSGELGDMDA